MGSPIMDAEENVSILLGNPKVAIRRLALPLILSLLVSQVNVLADRAWCSGLGVDAMAAIAVVTPIYMTIVGLGSGLGVGASAVISRMIGADRKDSACEAASQSLLFGIVFAIVLTPILLISQRSILTVLGAGDVIDMAESYLIVYSICTIIILINGAIGGILNGQGATSLSTVMMIVMAVSNIILDPVFIYGLNMGVQGAAIATVIATVFSLILGIYFILGRRTYLTVDRKHMKYDSEQMKLVTVAAVPQMIEYAIMYTMNAILNIIVINTGGSEGLTVYSTPDNLIDLIVIPAMAIGSALVPVASSAFGQKDVERMKGSFRYALILSISCVICLALLAELFSEQALFIFTYSGEMESLRPTMVHALRIMCLYSALFAFTPICSGYLQAMGRPNYSVFCAIWRNLALIVSFITLASFMNMDGIFWGLVLGHSIGAVTILCVALLTQKKVKAKIAAES
jgi:putative MATE family efflux protein